MTKGLWKIVGLCGVGATVLIAAFAFDTKEEVAAEQADADLTARACAKYIAGSSWNGANPRMLAGQRECIDWFVRGKHRNSAAIERFRAEIAERDRQEHAASKQSDGDCEFPFPHVCSSDAPWPIIEVARVVYPVGHEARTAIREEIAQRDREEAREEHNAVPRAFMDKPMLARMIAKIPKDAVTTADIEERLYRMALDIPKRELPQLLKELGFPDSGLDADLESQYLLPVASELANFRELPKAQKQWAIDGYRDPNRQMAVMRWLEKEVSTSFTRADAIRVVLMQKAFEELAPEYLMELQLECGFDERSIVPSVGPRTTACLENLAQNIALKRSAVPCMGLTGPAACESIADPRWNDIEYELNWPGAVPNPPPQRGIVRDGD